MLPLNHQALKPQVHGIRVFLSNVRSAVETLTLNTSIYEISVHLSDSRWARQILVNATPRHGNLRLWGVFAALHQSILTTVLNRLRISSLSAPLALASVILLACSDSPGAPSFRLYLCINRAPSQSIADSCVFSPNVVLKSWELVSSRIVKTALDSFCRLKCPGYYRYSHISLFRSKARPPFLLSHPLTLVHSKPPVLLDLLISLSPLLPLYQQNRPVFHSKSCFAQSHNQYNLL